jgi:hypothetical protein
MATGTARLRLAAPRALALRLLGIALGGLLVSGCAHYRLGTGGTTTFSTLYVAPVVNHAGLPQAQAIAAADIRNAFAKDGRVALPASAETADAVLAVTLTRYERQVAASNPNDTGLARKFALVLQASCTLTDRRNGKVLFRDRPLRAIRDAFVDSGQLQSEYEAWPLLTRTLADEIRHTVLDVW